MSIHHIYDCQSSILNLIHQCILFTIFQLNSVSKQALRIPFCLKLKEGEKVNVFHKAAPLCVINLVKTVNSIEVYQKSSKSVH